MGMDSRTTLAHLLKEIDGFSWPEFSGNAVCQYDGEVKFSNELYAQHGGAFIVMPFIEDTDVKVNPLRLLPSHHSCSKEEFYSL
jgi:hypothetical protein|nr:MAG TPA: hypothetical protein [Caudoviricetes sp.]